MARFLTSWMRLTLALLTALSTHMAHAALTPGEIADFSNGLALDTFALKDLINDIVADDNGGALQDVFQQYNHIIDTLGAQFQYLPGTSAIDDAGEQQSVFEAYSNFVQGLLELSDAIIAGAETLVDLDPRNYFSIPSAESNLQSVFDAYAFSIIALYADDNDIHDQMVVQKSRVDASILRANAAIHSTNDGVPPVPDPNPPATLTTSTTAGPTTSTAQSSTRTPTTMITSSTWTRPAGSATPIPTPPTPPAEWTSAPIQPSPPSHPGRPTRTPSVG